jgi:hypothetical protein
MELLWTLERTRDNPPTRWACIDDYFGCLSLYTYSLVCTQLLAVCVGSYLLAIAPSSATYQTVVVEIDRKSSMNIVVLAWRHWSAGRRFRSLLLNAPKAGHTVYGIAGTHLGDMQMSLDILKGYSGVTAFPQGQPVEPLHPDVIFGEYYFKNVALEYPVIDWANSKGIPSIIIDHNEYCPVHCISRPGHWKHPRFVTANEMQRQLVTSQQEGGWPSEQCVVLGSPNADTYLEPVDVAAVKNRLGIGGQPVIGLFIGHDSYPTQLLNHTSKWWVGIHAHPQERRQSNTNSAWGFYYTEGPQFHANAKSKGAHFLVDYLPGTICNVPMELCTSYELLSIADVVLTSSVDIIAQGYLLGKKVHTLAYPLGPPADWLHNVIADLVDADYESETPDLNKILQGLQTPQSFQPDPTIQQKWVTYCDRNWWARALELAEELCNKSGH